jgi:hypothetical protein
MPSHQHSFIVHELDSAISFPLATSVISPIEHHTSSSNVHAKSPLSLDKPVNLSDLPYIKSDPNFLHQCPPLQKFKKSYDYTLKFQHEWATKFPWVEEVLVANGITLFQILGDGHPMVEYEKRKALYSFIGVLKNPKMHWLDFSGWVMVEFMYAQVTSAIMVVVSITNHVALTCDEVNKWIMGTGFPFMHILCKTGLEFQC